MIISTEGEIITFRVFMSHAEKYVKEDADKEEEGHLGEGRDGDEVYLCKFNSELLKIVKEDWTGRACT